jgi:hypothetical protein
MTFSTTSAGMSIGTINARSNSAAGVVGSGVTCTQWAGSPSAAAA